MILKMFQIQRLLMGNLNFINAYHYFNFKTEGIYKKSATFTLPDEEFAIKGLPISTITDISFFAFNYHYL